MKPFRRTLNDALAKTFIILVRKKKCTALHVILIFQKNMYLKYICIFLLKKKITQIGYLWIRL